MTNTTHAKFRREDVAYLAGIIDGEGTFNIYKSKANKFIARLYVVNTNESLINWLQMTFGGLIYIRHHIKWKTRYEWIFEKRNIIDIINLIYPFLIIKKNQAHLMREFRATFPKKRKRLSKAVIRRREEIFLKLKHLNTRSS